MSADREPPPRDADAVADAGHDERWPAKPRGVPAIYFDGRSAQARDVRIQVQQRNLVVIDRHGTTIDHQALALIKVQEALRNAPQRIDMANGATLVVADKPRLAALLSDAGIEPGFIEKALRSWFSVGCAMVALAALLWCIYLWLLPWAASIAVRWLPSSVEDRIAEQVWPLVDANLFEPSALPADRQKRIREHFAELVARLPDPPEYLLEFRAWSGGANAYALPGGRIVVTDQMVARAGEGDALMGVLAHELGHVAYRHTMRTLIQGAAVSGIFTTFFGDASTLVAAIPSSLVTLKYSRDFERDADDYAVRSLKTAGLPVAPLADLLRTFSDDGSLAPQIHRFLSAHPVRSERIERMLEQADGVERRLAAPAR